MKKFYYIFVLLLTSSLLLSACTTNREEETTTTTQKVTSESGVTYDEHDLDEDYSDENPQTITLAKTTIEYDGTGATVSNSTITIQEAGTYVVSGTLNDGNIIVDADKSDLVRIVLKDATITSSTTAPIYVKQADKVLLTLAKDSKNTLCDGTSYVLADSSVKEPNATIFSKDDLTINGSGSLVVNANYNNGIQSKDDLKIVNGNISVTSLDNGIIGKDVLAIRDGTIVVNAQGDGLRSTNTTDTSKGIISIDGGNLTIQAAQDGIQSENILYINDGTIAITAGGGSSNGTKMRQEQGFNPFEQQQSSDTDTNTVSMKGLKAVNTLMIKGGTLTIDSADDALHSNGDITIAKGVLTLSSGDDGIHSDTALTIKKGTITIKTSYEGLEADTITIQGGTIHVNATDDGVNASGNTSLLQMEGGYLFVYADGDGLDSNGDITMSDGTIIIEGTQSGGDGALDFDGSFTISGGTLIASGSAEMLQYPTSVSNGNQMVIAFDTTMTDMLHLETSEAEAILTYQPSRSYQVVTIFSEKLKSDDTIEIYTGGSATSGKDGVYEDTSYTGGTLYQETTLADTTTTIGTVHSGMNGGGGMGGGPGGDVGEEPKFR